MFLISLVKYSVDYSIIILKAILLALLFIVLLLIY